MSYRDNSNSTYHDSISTMLLYTQCRERPDIQSSRVWKHSALVLMPAENRLHCSERGRWLGWSVAGEISRQQNTYAALQHIYLQPEDLRKLSLMARTLQCSCQAAGNYHLKVPFSLIPQQFFKRGTLRNKCEMSPKKKKQDDNLDLHSKVEPFSVLNIKIKLNTQMNGNSPSPLCLLKIFFFNFIIIYSSSHHPSSIENWLRFVLCTFYWQLQNTLLT